MNRDKENLSIKNNTSKDRKSSNTFTTNLYSKKTNAVKTFENNSISIDKAAQNERKGGYNSRKTMNAALGSKQKQVEESKIKRKSVSPCALGKTKIFSKNTNIKCENKSKRSEPDSNVQTIPEANIDSSANLKQTALQEIKDSENKSSKTKRKYSIFASESESEKEVFHKLQTKLKVCLNKYEESNEQWIVNFKEEVLNQEFELDEATYLPKTLSSPASKILNLQSFWILWIEMIKQSQNEISIQHLVDLFNESFKHINEENLVKSYYLKNIKQVDVSKMREYIETRGKTFNDSSSITNDVYFSLLDSFAQFFLRSQDKQPTNNKSSDGKKMRKNFHSENISSCQDVDLMISSKLKREFVHTEISQNENFVFSKTKIIPKLDIENNFFQFKTPIAKEVSDALIQNSDDKLAKSIQEEDEQHASLTSSCKSISLKENSELRDLVKEPLHHYTEKTENMIVSQNTVDKQIEFWNNLNNANCQSVNVSQSNFDNELPNQVNYSMYPNATQESIDFHEYNVNPFLEKHNDSSAVAISLEQEDECYGKINDSEAEIKEEVKEDNEQELAKEEGHIPNDDNTNKDEDSEEKMVENKEKLLNSPFNSFKIKSNEQETIENFKMQNNNSYVDNFQRDCSKFIEDEENVERTERLFESEVEEGSKKIIEDENLDRIGELQSQYESFENNTNNIHSNSLKEHLNLNLSVNSNTSHSRSRSRRRSKYQSMISEEFPTDLVGGSIRTFNQSFSGLESIQKSEKFPSSSKWREEN